MLRLVGAVMGTPADVVKARMMNQATDRSGWRMTTPDISFLLDPLHDCVIPSLGRGTVYKSSSDCLMQTVRGEGFMGK